MKKTLQNAAPLLGLAVVTTLLCYVMLSPEGRNDSHWWRMVLAGSGIAFVGAYVLLGKAAESVRQTGLQAVRALLVVTVVFGWFNYYQNDKKVFDGLGDYTDITYYYVNSKYLGELGYFGLYPAMIVADAEGPNRHSSKITQYRDLRDYEVKPVKVAYEHGREIKENAFTPERWKQFAHDVDYFISRKNTRSMRSNFYVDHGYNPPPTWSVPGAFLANLAPVENIKSIARVDMVLVAGMFVGIAWAFGIDAMLLAMLFFVSTFSGRWPMLGEALLRFDWLAALVLSMCFLKKERWALAGLFLAYAGLNRIFPTIFFWGWGAVFLYDTWRERRILPRHLKFAGGAGAMAVFLIGMALVQFGPETFKHSSKNLLMHNKSYSSHRVGLGDLALFRGEKTRAEMAKTVYAHGPGDKPTKGIQAKEYILRHNQHWLRLAAVLTLLFLTVYGYRSKREAWELMPLAILPFYCATNPQINYYNLRLLLFIWHGWALSTGSRKQAFHGIGLLILFACELATQFAFLSEVPDPRKPERMIPVVRYYVTSTTSLWLAFYFVGLVVSLVQDGWQREGDDEDGEPMGEAAYTAA